VKCFGGIYEIHAVLRREWEWGKLGLIIFWVLGGGTREGAEEGGTMYVWGNLLVVLPSMGWACVR
jgi:hypothetical protein